MAQNSSRKALHILAPFCLLLLIHNATGYEFKVGGPGNWSVPSDPSTGTYSQWAERSRFQIGDTIVFNYPADKDSVLLVNKDDFTNCNTAAPLEKYSDGHTIFKFNHSGPFYFISGVQDNCKNNEKVAIIVLADRSNHSSASASPPSPSTSETNSPSPAPSGEEAPSPPTGSVEINPTPAPSQESPPKSDGALFVTGLFTSIGALVGSSALLF
ncbi:PREDICTED: early nodulin-like protein 1 [Ipomoea nil]|uniref:early nodulin-like protein 1 n=1 Tax=Ipomoea nil TaxID=35883 RepID=UPI000901E4E7|nr:PREDICTED: early nodulin-like protein 1 [Ipomoea nil]